jgi:SAM-dependent methyltransferase
MSHNKILTDINEYYSQKLREHGTTPKGVDWNGIESQELRFKTLLNIVNSNTDSFSVLDYGCGFGSMYEFMKKKFSHFSYTGFDISEEMIRAASKLYSDSKWISTAPEIKTYDYVIASGIFNVRLSNIDSDWHKYIIDTITYMNQISTKGFSFNVLTSYSDKEFMRDYLYYANPLDLFDYCKKNFSKQVALLHDYNLYEFTLLIRK